MTIYGSANVTDWEAEVKTIRGQVVIRNLDQADWSEADASWFESVEIALPVEDIDADSRRMNNNMHDYLKKDEYPEITYRVIDAREVVLADNPDIVLTVQGVITAAGVEKEIVHDVEIRKSETGGLVVSGSQDLLMTDFGIDPPTAVFGSIRSRDEMTITFELHLEQ
ncbi:MAG: YceI family protein [Balneolaceae bacterium]|nr:MAG: YceI family protein [Balneolaceae bacterium]